MFYRKFFIDLAAYSVFFALSFQFENRSTLAQEKDPIMISVSLDPVLLDAETSEAFVDAKIHGSLSASEIDFHRSSGVATIFTPKTDWPCFWGCIILRKPVKLKHDVHLHLTPTLPSKMLVSQTFVMQSEITYETLPLVMSIRTYPTVRKRIGLFIEDEEPLRISELRGLQFRIREIDQDIVRRQPEGPTN